MSDPIDTKALRQHLQRLLALVSERRGQPQWLEIRAHWSPGEPALIDERIIYAPDLVALLDAAEARAGQLEAQVKELDRAYLLTTEGYLKAQDRIAELEARTVVLPTKHYTTDEGGQDFDFYDPIEMIAALKAAGVGVKI